MIATGLLLLWTGLACPPAGAQPSVTVQTITAPVNTLTVGDIDFLNSSTPRWLFTVTMSTAHPNPLDITLRLRVTVVLASGEHLGDVISMVTQPIELIQARSITNLDLRNESVMRREDYVVNQASRRRLEELALPSGMLPAGMYTFLAEAFVDINDQPVGLDDDEITITNPSTVELLAPFDGDQSNPFPLFQWRGDAPEWTLAVFELMPRHASNEEAASGVPHLTATTTGLSYQYPTSGPGVRALEPGKSYVWYVEGRITGAGGATSPLRSEIRSFTVGTTGSTGGVSASWLDQLEQALGPKHRAVFDRIRSDGLSPTGMIRLNGSTISTTELLGLIGRIRRNPDAVSVVLE